MSHHVSFGLSSTFPAIEIAFSSISAVSASAIPARNHSSQPFSSDFTDLLILTTYDSITDNRPSLTPALHLRHNSDMSDPETNDGSNPSSKLLHDLLREKKAQSRKVGKPHDLDPRRGTGRISSLDNREVRSSPIAPSANKDFSVTQGRRGSVLGQRNNSLTPKEWGMREIDVVSNPKLPCEV